MVVFRNAAISRRGRGLGRGGSFVIKDDGSGSFFLTCHLRDPGQFKSDCSGRQALETCCYTFMVLCRVAVLPF